MIACHEVTGCGGISRDNIWMTKVARTLYVRMQGGGGGTSVQIHFRYDLQCSHQEVILLLSGQTFRPRGGLCSVFSF